MNKTLVLNVLCVLGLCLGMYSCKSTVATSDLNLVNGKIEGL